MLVGIVCEQGLRESMEDTYCLNTNLNNKGWIFGGVFDGHRGNFAATYTALNLPQNFLQELKQRKHPLQAISRAYKDIAQDLDNQQSGTTATSFFINKQSIYLSHLGDSKALLLEKENFFQLTEEHRLNNPAERSRIEDCGAQITYPYICKNGQGIMLTRTLGDGDFKHTGVISTPFLAQHEIKKQDKILVLGTDGLFDVLSNREIFKLTKDTDNPQSIAENLAEEAMLNRMSVDNITVLVLDLQEALEN